MPIIITNDRVMSVLCYRVIAQSAPRKDVDSVLPWPRDLGVLRVKIDSPLPGIKITINPPLCGVGTHPVLGNKKMGPSLSVCRKYNLNQPRFVLALTQHIHVDLSLSSVSVTHQHYN